jgi:hypothetical protein
MYQDDSRLLAVSGKSHGISHLAEAPKKWISMT